MSINIDMTMTEALELYVSTQTETQISNDDLISRADAIEAIHREARIAGDSVAIEYADMFQDAIYDIPSAQPKQGWIPCEERLPENGHYYLWCSDMGSVQSDYYWDGFEKEQKYGYNIVAWMPLPQSYNGARQTDSENRTTASERSE